MRTTFCVLIGLAFTMAAFAGAPADAEAIKGTWALESMKSDGKPVSAKDAGDFGIVITADGIANSTDPNKKAEKSPYKLDPSKSPKWITMDQKLVLGNKDSKGNPVQRVVVQKMLGIYKIEDDQLTICWSTRSTAPTFDQTGRVTNTGSSTVRPDSFDGGPGTLLFVLKRAAK